MWAKTFVPHVEDEALADPRGDPALAE